MNKVILSGNLGKDIELRNTTSGKPVANFSLATNNTWRDDQGKLRKATEWHDIEAWGPQAQAAADHLRKGSRALIEGHLKTDKWQDAQSGQPRYRVKIVAERIEFLDRKAGEDSEPDAEPQAA